MSAVPILGVLALAGAIVAWVTWHRTVDERHSVEHHQHALETLRHVAGRAEHPARPRPAAPGQRRPHASNGEARARPPRAARDGFAPGARRNGAARVPRPSPPTAAVAAAGRASKRAPSPRHPTMVFVDEASNSPDRAPEGPVVGDGGPRRLRTSRAGVRPMPRRTTTVAAGSSIAVVVAVVLGVALSSGAPPPVAHGTRPHAGHVGARGIGAPGSSRGGHGAPSPSKATSAPSTTAPRGPAALVASSAQPHGATYAAPASPYTVAIDASGLCWVLAEEVPSGQVLWTGTLQAGATRSFSGSGTVQVRLGAASDVTVSLDGSPVALPAGFQSPFDVTVSA